MNYIGGRCIFTACHLPAIVIQSGTVFFFLFEEQSSPVVHIWINFLFYPKIDCLPMANFFIEHQFEVVCISHYVTLTSFCLLERVA